MSRNGILKLLTSLFLVITAAVRADQYGDFTYSTDGTNVTITGYTGSGGNVTIPASINDLPVTSIGVPGGPGVFEDNVTVTNVVISDGITDIEDYTFYECLNLTNVIIGNGVTSIGLWAFEGDPLSSLKIPDSVTSIWFAAFAYCNYLSSVVIPDGVTILDNDVFSNCSSLTNAILGKGITIIGVETFQYDPLSSISISDNVLSIGSYAFYNCASLQNVRIGNSVTSIGSYAFSGCNELTSVFFKGNAPVVDGSVFGAIEGYYFGFATIYCLPGTTGWVTFNQNSDLPPAVLWNPQAQTSDGGFGVGPNGFGFNITGTTNIPIVVVAATNLNGPSWAVLQSCTLTNGSVYFSDPAWTNYPSRFYRIRSP